MNSAFKIMWLVPFTIYPRQKTVVDGLLFRTRREARDYAKGQAIMRVQVRLV